MATNQVNPVNITVSITAGDIAKEERENERRANKRAGVDVSGDTVSVKTSTTVGTSTLGETKTPPRRSLHEGLKSAQTTLQGAIKKTGIELKVGDNLVAKAHEALDGLDEKIAKYVEHGGKKDELAKWEIQRDDILDALTALEALQADVSETNATVQSASLSESATGTGAETGTETLEPLWNALDKDLNTIGVVVDKSETDIELVKNKVTALFSKTLAAFKEKEQTLTAKSRDLEAQLKDESNPADKKRIETELKAVKVELDQVLRDKKNLQISFLNVNESLMKYEAASDLGIVPEPKTETRTASMQSASAPAAPATTSKKTSKTSSTVTTSSAGGSTAAGQTAQTFGAGGGVSLNTASAGGGGGAPSVSASLGGQDDVSGAGLLSTESEAPTGSTNIATVSAMSDMTGTTLAIASTSNALRSETRKTEDAIKKLLRAAMSGNYEAIKTCLILLDKKSSQTVISMGTSTIKAMQSYETQMGELSKSMEKLSTQDPSYNAKLAKINSDMNMYSMNRQAISNFLRDTMSMREEVGNLTHGVLTKDAQIGSGLSRWG